MSRSPQEGTVIYLIYSPSAYHLCIWLQCSSFHRCSSSSLSVTRPHTDDRCGTLPRRRWSKGTSNNYAELEVRRRRRASGGRLAGTGLGCGGVAQRLTLPHPFLHPTPSTPFPPASQPASQPLSPDPLAHFTSRVPSFSFLRILFIIILCTFLMHRRQTTPAQGSRAWWPRR